MSDIFISPRALPALSEYLRSLGHRLRFTGSPDTDATALHPDLCYCKLGAAPEAPVLAGVRVPGYPREAAMCAVVLDKYLIHRLDITAPRLFDVSKERGLVPVNVRQGYAKCSVAVVDGSSVITSDAGIIRALKRLPNIDVLPVREGFVELPGFDTGFLGGASGRVGNEMLFNGDLSAHPDFEQIKDFILAKGLALKFFPGEPLTDIGSIIEAGNIIY